MNPLNFIAKNIFSILYVLALLLLFADSYASDDTIVKFLHITSRSVAIYSLIFLAGIRVLSNHRLTPILSKINSFLIFPLSLATCIVLTIYDYNTPPNAAFALVRIQYIQLCLVSIFSLIVILLQQSSGWFRRYYQYVIFGGFFAIFGYAYLSTFFPLDIFTNISKEDHFIENLQFFVLLTGSLFSLLASKLLYKKQRIHSVVFLIVAVVLLLVAGDEISWGQRIFHLTTPDIILQNNDQNEITIHNLSTFSGLVGIGYVVIGFYGAFAWLFQVVIPRLKKIPFAYYIPAWFCMGYYFLGFLYNYYNRAIMYHPYSVWSEFAELMLYSGIMFTLLGLLIKLKKGKRR